MRMRMRMRMSVTEHEVAESGVGEERVLEWEAGLPGVDDLMPLSQLLIPPDLASAFVILPEPYRTILEVNRASRNTLSSIRCQSLSSSNNFKSFNEDRDDLMVPETLDGPMVSEPDRDVPGSGSDSRKSRKLDSGEESDSAFRSNESTDESSARTLKRPRLVWTPQLHKRFIEVVDRLGIKNAVPKTIMQLMNVEGLTRENVASHLQKYRIYLKRRQGSSSELPSSPDHLVASTLVPREPAINNGHVAAQIPMPYQGHVMPMLLLGVGHVGMPFGNPNGYLRRHGYNWSPMVSYPQAARTDN